MERRTHARIARKLLNHIPVTFSGNANGTGTLYDLSSGGCQIGARSTPPLGTSLTLRIALFNKTTPVKIDAAIVGWTIKDQYFGVKFLKVEPTERLALDRFIASIGVGAPLTLF
jgi:c-di-GMP-binding flagellar brake protein YcgR